jgi:hypothetical protein
MATEFLVIDGFTLAVICAPNSQQFMTDGERKAEACARRIMDASNEAAREAGGEHWPPFGARYSIRRMEIPFGRWDSSPAPNFPN